LSASIAIVSAADSGYFRLLKGLALSLEAVRGTIPFDLCVFDLGLDPDQRAFMDTRCQAMTRPGWDIAFPGMDKAPDHYKAMVSRPFIPRHFPGYDIYLWLDADSWVQDPAVIEVYVRAARRGRIAITAQIDRAYKGAYKRGKIFGWTHNHKHFRLGFGWRAADRFGPYPVLNSGAFSIPGSAKHWSLWADALRQALQRSQHKLMEQTALNLVLYRNRADITILPAYCNWLCDAAAPCIDDDNGLLVEPFEPHQALGIVHLAGEFEREGELDLRTIAGREVRTRLTFEEWMEERATLFQTTALPPGEG
jgi:hypothetical protein